MQKIFRLGLWILSTAWLVAQALLVSTCPVLCGPLNLFARNSALSTAGGAADSPAHFYITAKDSRGTRIKDGGAYVVVTARAVGPAANSPPVHGSVKDNKDGSYTATYTVPSRGNYEVSTYHTTPNFPPADNIKQFR